MQLIGNTWIPDGDMHFAGVFQNNDIFCPQDLLTGLEFVKEWDCAIDGGAHVGSWTRYMARGFGHVFSFEPQPENYQCLIRNTAGLENVKATRVALGEFYRPSVCMEPGTNTGGWHVGEGSGVAMMALDEFRPLRSRKVGYLKLDVEGCEWFAIKGAQKLIRRCWPVVQVEEKGHEKRYYNSPQARELLESMGYKEAARSGRDVIFTKD